MNRLFLFLFFVISTVLFALDPERSVSEYNVKIWNSESGLPGNSAMVIKQTSDGYLWIGTQDGLVRFDGITFEVYNKETVPALGGNEIRALYEDHDGTLWIGGKSQNLVKYKDGKFFAFPIKNKIELSTALAIEQDKWGNLWLGCFNQGIFCLDKDKRWVSNPAWKEQIGSQVRSIYKDMNNDLWFISYSGLFRLNAPFKFDHYASPGAEKTAGLYETNKKTLWIGTGSEGLFSIKNGKRVLFDTGFESIPQSINVLFMDKGNQLWIGTDGDGLKRLNSPGGIPCGAVYSIYEDMEGSLWVGTVDKGLYRLSDSPFVTYSIREGLDTERVNCVLECSNRDILVGTEKGLNGFKNEKFFTVPFAVENISNVRVSCLLEHTDGTLMIGTWDGLYIYVYKNRTLIRITKQNGLSNDKIKCIAKDMNGDTWIGTENGLNRLDHTRGKIEPFIYESGIPGKKIEFILAGSDGKIRVGTDAGLFWIQNGKASPYSLPKGIDKNSLTCGYEDSKGFFWFGAGNNLVRIKEAGEGPVFDVVLNVLGDIDIGSIIEDQDHYFWLAGRNGIIRVKKSDIEDFISTKIKTIPTEKFDETDGMKSRVCVGPGYQTQNGQLWFPTTQGVSMIELSRMKRVNNPIPPVVLEKLVVDGEPKDIKSTLELNPGQKRLEFFYKAITLTNPQETKFRTKLEGFDKDWVEMGIRRVAVYTRLAPGSYTFRVKASNSNGKWNEEDLQIPIYLRPYFWQTTWFYIPALVLILLGAILTVHFIIKHRSQKLVKEKQKLEAIVAERTREIQEKNLQLQTQTKTLEDQSVKLKEMDKIKSRFFANISHEFRTPLTLIMGPLEQIVFESTDKELQRKARLMFRNSQRLLSLINQLLELSKFDSGAMKLQACYADIVPFLKGVLHSFDSLAAHHELELLFQAPEAGIFLYFDPDKLEEVVSNLLSNAVKFTPAGGRIIMGVNTAKSQEHLDQPDFLEISVKDTGPGIPGEQLSYIFDRFFQADSTIEHHRKGSGIGLAIAREIVELHHGTISARNKDNGESGSQFIILLPLGSAHLSPSEIIQSQPMKQQQEKVSRVLSSFENHEEEEQENHEEEPCGPSENIESSKNIILVIEDSPDVREYIRGALCSQYRIIEAVSGEEGIEKAREVIPDLIISDVMMPGIDGYEVCNVLKNDVRVSHIPIIMLTARAGEENVIKGFETGADDYITKPFSVKILSARIKNLIELRKHLQMTVSREMSFQPVDIPVSKIDKEFLRDLQDVLEKHLSDTEFNVEQLCKKLYMSGATVYRKVQALVGETPTEFIRSYRLKRAAELLKKGGGSVTEVAFEVGFSSRAYFTRCFREKFHQLPSDYIKTF